ncbi:hypothetical protein PR048_009563 [Dryococelus australis]|uniref:Uncharacterized protein n=1 Tax=Dryococelus australis TaxID=614101 RepID=A0ABQ9I089_9NEOP|nr:hypothetical protein PR048_009563 [Dryococelus australis]
MPLKPHKWGYKLFVLYGVSGFAYKVEIYTEMENVVSKRKNCEPGIGASVINTCLLYRHVSATKCLNRNKTMNLADFKMEVATAFGMTGKQTLSKRGKPSELNQQFAEKKKGPATHIPPSDVRLDQMQHLPE